MASGQCLIDNRLLLLDEELDNLLLHLLRLGLQGVGVVITAKLEPLRFLSLELLLLARAVSLELVILGFTLLQDLLRLRAALELVLEVEFGAVLFKVLLDVLDLLGREEGRRSGPPQELAELVERTALQDLTLERPEPVGVVDLVAPP